MEIGNPCISFLMVIVASGVVRGCMTSLSCIRAILVDLSKLERKDEKSLRKEAKGLQEMSHNQRDRARVHRQKKKEEKRKRNAK